MNSEIPLDEFFPHVRAAILNHKPKRLPIGTENKEAGDFYGKCSIAQMEEGDFLWAWIEYTKAGLPELAKLWDVKK